MRSKVEHVKSAGQTRRHSCHWPDCDRQVPPAMWGCRRHWYMLPYEIRRRIWAAYKPGQETSGRPSKAYVEAAREAQDWIAENYSLNLFSDRASGRKPHLDEIDGDSE